MDVHPSARMRLLDAAEHLAFTHGVAATPVDAILRRAAVAPATLYAHFGNKEGLIVEALQRRLARWDEAWQLEIDGATTDRARLLAVFPALTRHRSGLTPARWCAFLGVAAESVQPGDALADVLSRDTDLLSARLHELSVPVVGADRAEVLAARLLLVFTGVLGMMLRGAEPGAAIDDGMATAELIIDATVPRPTGA